MNQEGPQEQEGGTGAGADGGPQGRLAISLSGGGPTGLGLLSLAFPSNIMTLVWRRGGGGRKAGLGFLPSSRERSSQSSCLQGPQPNALASILQWDLLYVKGLLVPFHRTKN